MREQEREQELNTSSRVVVCEAVGPLDLVTHHRCLGGQGRWGMRTPPRGGFEGFEPSGISIEMPEHIVPTICRVSGRGVRASRVQR